MKSLSEEIELFVSNSKLNISTKQKHYKCLTEFLYYLEKITETETQTIHLERIYELVDSTGKTIMYKKIDSKILDEFLFSKSQLKYGALASYRNALGSFFKYLNFKYDFPNITQELTFKLSDYRQSKVPRKVLSRHDVLKFIRSIIKYSDNYYRDLLLFILLLSTGSRISEILNIKVNQIDFENDFIYLGKTKNGRDKIVVLRENYGRFIIEYIKMNEITNDDYLFVENGKLLSRIYVQETFNFYLKKANLPLTNLHQIRHTFATLMAESGANLSIIQQLLGHVTINTTKTYVNPNYIRNMGLKINENKEVFRHIRKLKISKPF